MVEPMHAPPEVLAERAEINIGLGSASSASADWVDHIAHCAECERRVNEFEEVLRSLKAGDAGDAPDTWIRRAELRAVPRRFQAPLKGELRASLVFDNAFDRVSGARADGLLARQFVVAADALEIEISLSPENGERWPLTGQIFVTEGAAPTPLDCRVALIEDGADRAHTVATENGEFMFELRPLGRFQLRFQGREWLVVTPVLVP